MMTWTQTLAAMAVSVVLLSPFKIFIGNNSNDPSTPNAFEGKSTWDLIKEIQKSVEADERQASRTPGIWQDAHASPQLASKHGDPITRSVLEKRRGNSMDLNRGPKARGPAPPESFAGPPPSYNPLKLMLSFWAKDGADDEILKHPQEDPISMDFDSNDPLQNGLMLAVSGVLLFAMVLVLIFDVGGKTSWPVRMLSRGSLFGFQSPSLVSQSESGTEKLGNRRTSRIDDDEVQEIADARHSGVELRRKRTASHRVEKYLEDRRSKSASESHPISRRKVSLGFDKTAHHDSSTRSEKRSTSHVANSGPTSPVIGSKREAQRDEERRMSQSQREQQVAPVRGQQRGLEDPATSGLYQVIPPSQISQRSSRMDEQSTASLRKEPMKQRASYTYSSQSAELLNVLKKAEQKLSSADGDVALNASSSFAVAANPDDQQQKRIQHQGVQAANQQDNKSVQTCQQQEYLGETTTSEEGVGDGNIKPGAPAYLNCVLQSLCQCPILKYFFVEGPSQVYFEDGERLSSTLTRLFAAFIRDVWNPPPHLKISADQLQLAWTESVAKMFNVSHPTLEQFLSAFFLTLYTDIRSVAKARRRHSSLPEEVTRIGRLIGASFLERRKLKVRICDENGADVPHELLAHSALTFPGVTFSSPGADSNESKGLEALLNSVCHTSATFPSALKIDNESMQIPCLLNFHYPGHYFTSFPEKLFIKEDPQAQSGDSPNQLNEQSEQNDSAVCGELFSLYAVVFQTVKGQESYSVAIKHAVRGHWYYTEGSSVAKCKVSPSAGLPRIQSGSRPRPILLLYVAAKWNENLPFFDAECAAEKAANNKAAAGHQQQHEMMGDSNRVYTSDQQQQW